MRAMVQLNVETVCVVSAHDVELSRCRRPEDCLQEIDDALSAINDGERGGLPMASIALEQWAKVDADHAVRFLAALAHSKPLGQRAAITACAQAACVPKLRRNSGKDMPCWNWILFIAMAKLRRGMLPAYGGPVARHVSQA